MQRLEISRVLHDLDPRETLLRIPAQTAVSQNILVPSDSARQFSTNDDRIAERPHFLKMTNLAQTDVC